jgi:hypothetical protein
VEADIAVGVELVAGGVELITGASGALLSRNMMSRCSFYHAHVSVSIVDVSHIGSEVFFPLLRRDIGLEKSDLHLLLVQHRPTTSRQPYPLSLSQEWPCFPPCRKSAPSLAIFAALLTMGRQCYRSWMEAAFLVLGENHTSQYTLLAILDPFEDMDKLELSVPLSPW